LVFVFKAGSGPHINNIELGKHGRYRTNIWSYAGINSFGKDRDAELALHPTVKPVALVADTILDCSKRGGIVLDPFAGSGTTLIAAERTGRRGYGIELDPRYCDVIVKRMAGALKAEAVHAATGKPFAEIERERRSNGSLAGKSAQSRRSRDGGPEKAQWRLRGRLRQAAEVGSDQEGREKEPQGAAEGPQEPQDRPA
jgi:hypothetical protein